jgi:putative nucleotidyltransferase with HDIG domain
VKQVGQFVGAVRRRAREALGRQAWIEKPHKPVIRPTLFRVLLGVGTVIVCSALLPLGEAGESLRQLRAGDISPREVVAPFTFPILKSPQELAEERARVLAEVPVVFSPNPGTLDSVLQCVRRPFAAADSVEKLPLPPDAEHGSLRRALPGYSDDAVRTLSYMSGRSRTADLIAGAVASAYTCEVADDSIAQRLPAGVPVVIVSGATERTVVRERLLSVSAARDRSVDLVSGQYQENSPIVRLSYEVISIAVVPSLRYDAEESEMRRQLALDAVSPSKGLVLENERIVGAHERITPEIEGKIASLLASRQTMRPLGPWGIVLPAAGRSFFVALVVLFVSVAIAYFRPEVFDNRRMLVLIAVLFTATLAASEALVIGMSASTYLIPVAFAPMLVAILIEAETGVLVAAALALLLGLQMRFDFGVTFFAAVGGVVGALSAMNFRHRSQIYVPMFLLAATVALVVFTLEGLRLTPFESILHEVFRAVVAVAVTPLVVVGILPIVEVLFGVTSEITLLELGDLNRPLLRELAVRAPGSFHHSIVVGNLSEAAAEAIGANPLLARVGAYYHDIGKLDRPEYFVENQTSPRSLHERLAPSMSALVLESHVRKGVDLAKRHGLPSVIVDFITQHHGTTLMKFFYQKALDQGADPSVEQEFRYNGPLPQSRETAILMLADAVEAAARTLAGEASSARMRNLIHRIVREKADSGQLADSRITLSELSRIEGAFVPVLLGIHHARVEYPIGEPK